MVREAMQGYARVCETRLLWSRGGKDPRLNRRQKTPCRCVAFQDGRGAANGSSSGRAGAPVNLWPASDLGPPCATEAVNEIRLGASGVRQTFFPSPT